MAELLVDKTGHTTILTINRPERLNAMGGTVDADLTAAIDEFQADADQYVAVITGTGDKAFCAGADLKEMADAAASGTRAPVAKIPDIAGIAACEKVTIAAINGLAIAGGLELSICCDIRVASENAWFGVFEVSRGILAGVAASVLPRLMPMGAVMDLMLTGGRLTAAEALNLGLVQQVVPQDRLMERVLEKADMVAQNSQAAVRGTKQVLKFWRDVLLADQQRYYEAVMHRVLLSGDFLEGPRAFSEKREPVFSQGWPSPFRAPG
jgi:enoyl-CoA hydratase/carnithine racemase